jgi:hypothetical protein
MVQAMLNSAGDDTVVNTRNGTVRAYGVEYVRERMDYEI